MDAMDQKDPNQRRISQAAFAESFKYSKCCFSFQVDSRRINSFCLALASALASKGAGCASTAARRAGTAGGAMSPIFTVSFYCVSVSNFQCSNVKIMAWPWPVARFTG